MSEPRLTLDEPAPGGAVDPLCFRVRGWLWLGPRHGELAAVEAWQDERCIGEVDWLYARPDVVAALDLPAGTLAGFQIIARLPPQPPGTRIPVAVRARLRSGERTPPLAPIEAVACAHAASPLGALLAAVRPAALGLEVGAHAQPVAGLAPYYTDNVAAFAGIPGRVDFLSSTIALPLADEALDYLCTSHVLEHLPDPIAALLEWERVLRPGGLLYLVVPDQRHTFDHPRAVTPVRHLLDDFITPASFARDAPHVGEFAHRIDVARLHYGSDPAGHAAWRERTFADLTAALQRGENVDLHFHTFTPDSLAGLLHALGFLGGPQARFEEVARAETYPADRADGFGLLLRKRNSPVAVAPVAAPTYALRSSPGLPPLPLVCPLTLEPLAEANHVAERVLRTLDGRQRYAFDPAAGVPALFADPARVRRSWSGWLGRRRVWAAAGTRMMLASAR